jgi:hypothetical protein
MQQEYTDGKTEPLNKSTESFTFQKPVHSCKVSTFNVTLINKIWLQNTSANADNMLKGSRYVYHSMI